MDFIREHIVIIAIIVGVIVVTMIGYFFDKYVLNKKETDEKNEKLSK